MSKKISQFAELVNITGNEDIPIHLMGSNFKIKLSVVKKLITKDDVGLNNVNNTTDLDKPVSTATLAELNKKADKVHSHDVSEITNLLEFVNNASVNAATVNFIKTEW
jgi:hypothetical protein